MFLTNLLKSINYILVAVILLFILFIINSRCTREETKPVDNSEVINYYKDILRKTDAKHSKQKEVLTIQLELLQSRNDSLIKVISNHSTPKTKTATVFTSRDTITIVDTLYRSTVKDFEYSDKWININLKSDSTIFKLDLQLENKFVVTQDFIRERWYKPKKMYVNVTSYNPYTKIKNVSSYFSPYSHNYFEGNLFASVVLDGMYVRPFIGLDLAYNKNKFNYGVIVGVSPTNTIYGIKVKYNLFKL